MFKNRMILGLIFVVGLGLWFGSGWAEGKKSTAEEKKEVELKISYKKTRGEVIKNVIIENREEEGIIYDETEMTVKAARILGVKGLEKRKPEEKVKVKYPKVVATEKAIKFLDKKGKIKKEFPLQLYIPGKQRASEINISPNRRYICVHNVKKTTEHGDVTKAESIILNTEGDILWKVEHALGFSKVSPNGKYIVGCLGKDTDNVPVQIFYSNGFVKEIKKDGRVGVKFSKDGSFVAICVETIDWKMKTEKHRDKYRLHLIVLDDEGNELWRKDEITKGEIAVWSGVTGITDDDLIEFTIYKPVLKRYYFDKKGNLVKLVKEE